MANGDDETIRKVLDLDPIAVVGCSSTPGKAAHEIPRYMRNHGYTVIPVNPYADSIFGREAYDSLDDVPVEVPLVNVFRPSDETGPIVDAALDRDDVEAIWLQLGIRNDAAADRAAAEDRLLVQDRCLKVEHRRFA